MTTMVMAGEPLQTPEQLLESVSDMTEEHEIDIARELGAMGAHVQNTVDGITNLRIEMGAGRSELKAEIERVRTENSADIRRMERTFVTKAEFQPMRWAVMAIFSVTFVAIIGLFVRWIAGAGGVNPIP